MHARFGVRADEIGAAVMSGRIRADYDTLDRAHVRYRELAERFADDLDVVAARLRGVSAPGDEPASHTAARAVTAYGGTYAARVAALGWNSDVLGVGVARSTRAYHGVDTSAGVAGRRLQRSLDPS